MDFRPCFISYGTVAPEIGSSYANILWFDITNVTLKRYNGTTWVDLAAPVGGGGGGGPHTHPISDIVALATELAAIDDTLADHDGAIAGKADAVHGHAQGDVTNLTSDLVAKQAVSEKGQANGYASLGVDGKVPSAQLPASGGGGTPVNYTSLLMGI